MATDFTDYAKFLEVTAPEIVEQFTAGYEDPLYPGGECNRCGAIVAGAYRHNQYHRALSLTIFVFGSTMQSLTNLMAAEDAPEEKRTTVETDAYVCKKCGFTDIIAEKRNWFKCCPTHTPQNSDAIMCEKCAIELHGKEMPEEYRTEDDGQTTSSADNGGS